MQHVIDGVDPLRVVVLKWHCSGSCSMGMLVLGEKNTVWEVIMHTGEIVLDIRKSV